AVHLNSNGTRDNSFGVGGVATYSFPGSTGDTAFSIVNNSGKILLGGESFQGPVNPQDDSRQSAFVQFTTTGALDGSFGQGGATYFKGSENDQSIFIPTATIRTMQVQGGVIVAAGVTHAGSGDNMFAMGLDADGSIATNFAAASGNWVSASFGLN